MAPAPDNIGVNLEKLERNLCHCYIFYHKSHMYYPGFERRRPDLKSENNHTRSNKSDLQVKQRYQWYVYPNIHGVTSHNIEICKVKESDAKIHRQMACSVEGLLSLYTLNGSS
jgi:hypothetical protein